MSASAKKRKSRDLPSKLMDFAQSVDDDTAEFKADDNGDSESFQTTKVQME